MSEESKESQVTSDQTADAGSVTTDVVVDWEKKYQEEVKSSKNYRTRAQTAEGKLDKSDKETEKARKKKMEEDGKLKELLVEQDKTIEALRVKADAGDQLLKDQHTRLLEQLPEDDREDFADLPTNQLAKVVNKLKASQSAKPEIPSVKGAIKSEDLSFKDLSKMTPKERSANWDATLTDYARRANINKS